MRAEAGVRSERCGVEWVESTRIMGVIAVTPENYGDLATVSGQTARNATLQRRSRVLVLKKLRTPVLGQHRLGLCYPKGEGGAKEGRRTPAERSAEFLFP
jgi:hypothetical protein